MNKNYTYWNEETKKYEVSTKLELTEEEFLKLINELFEGE